jgi:hypothetical protein
MKAKLGLAALLLSVLFWAPGGPAAHLAGSRLQPLARTPVQPASVTVPPEAPVVVPSAAALNNRGWAGTAAIAPSENLTGQVLAAYTLAVAVSPPQCHLTTSMLAAIGQVESGNLAGHTIDAHHRVSPAILGPVLDGQKYRAVADTDAGRWDHDTVWDRALGPMQIIPASWRVVGLDMDGDGVRDPQNIYDSAGATMAYLCSGGRDLSSPAALKQAILSYNESDSYLHAVLAWKSVFDAADLDGTGSVPFVASLAMPDTTSAPSALPAPSRSASPTTTTAAEPSPQSVPLTTSSRPTTTPGATTGGTGTSGSSTAPPASTGTPPASAGASSPSVPSTGSSSPGDDQPQSTPTPSQPADPTPANPSSGPTDLPTCPVPTEDPTEAPTGQPQADPATDEPVVSPETCTAPEGYQFDEDTGELVPVPTATPAP